MTASERTDAALCHYLALLGLVGHALLGLIGVLIIWQVKKDSSPFVNDQGKESVNFQLTLFICALISIPLCLLLIGFLLLAILYICGIVFPILGGIKAANGEAYRYPFNFRLIK